MKEAEYNYITYDTTSSFAQKLAGLNPDMIINYVSGSFTGSSEKGRVVCVRVEGKTVLSAPPSLANFNYSGVVFRTAISKHTVIIIK